MCPSCAARMHVSSNTVGKRISCPQCGVPFAAAPVAEAPGGAELAGSGHVGGLSDNADSGSVEVASITSLDWSQWSREFVRGLVPFGSPGKPCFVALIVGVLLIWYGVREDGLRSGSRVEPQVISCAQLLSQGPGDNLHVKMTGFVLLPNFVYEESKARWRGAWVPAVPVEAVGVALARVLGVAVSDLPAVDPHRRKEAADRLNASDFDVKIVVSLPNADGQDYVERVYDQDTIDGLLMVDDSLAKLDVDKRKMLERAYPQANLHECWILVEGRKPSSLARVLAFQGGGAGLILATLGLAGWRAARRSRRAEG